MVDIFSKKMLLMGEKKIEIVTLTVTTSPSNATCNLTYNGTTYTTKSIQVEKGSTVSYYISSSTDYFISSGSWVITEDTVKNVTLNHRTSTVALYFSNRYDNNSLTATLAIGSETKSRTATSHSVTLYPKIALPSYSYTVTHPTLGSKNGTGTATRKYSSLHVDVLLNSDGTWSVTTRNG